MPLSAYATTAPVVWHARVGGLGLRFDPYPTSALNLELVRTKNTDRVIEQWTDVMLDYAIQS